MCIRDSILTDPVVQTLLHSPSRDNDDEGDFQRVFTDTLTDSSTSNSEDEATVPTSNDTTPTKGNTSNKASKDVDFGVL